MAEKARAKKVKKAAIKDKPVKLHISTVNCSGKKRSGCGTSSQRFALLQKVIENSDVVLLQEVSFKKKLEELKDRYQVEWISGSSEVASLIKDGVFEACERYTGSAFQRELAKISKKDYKNETLDAGRFIFTKAAIGKEVFLFVSYHGQHTRASDSLKGVQLQMLCDLAKVVAAQKGAGHIIIGGDFNLKIEEAKRQLEGSSFTVSDYDVSDRRKDKNTLDYFLVSEEIEIEKVEPAGLSLEGLKPFKVDDGEIDEDKLSKCLDHDPVQMIISIKPKAPKAED